VKKAGDTDVSHKDYILTWGLAKRKSTAYTPDLWSKFGIDQNGQTVRLPTTYWPFDHAAVVVEVTVHRAPDLLDKACRRVLQWLADWHQEMLGLFGLALAVSFLSAVTVFRPYVNDTGREFHILEVPTYFCMALQLGITSVACMLRLRRPQSNSTYLTELYFKAALANNILFVGGFFRFVLASCSSTFSFPQGSHGEAAIIPGIAFGVGSLAGSVATIAILHKILQARLEAMVWGMGSGGLSVQKCTPSSLPLEHK
jgi:hypothetical protein